MLRSATVCTGHWHQGLAQMCVCVRTWMKICALTSCRNLTDASSQVKSFLHACSGQERFQWDHINSSRTSRQSGRNCSVSNLSQSTPHTPYALHHHSKSTNEQIFEKKEAKPCSIIKESFQIWCKCTRVTWVVDGLVNFWALKKSALHRHLVSAMPG